MNENGVSSDPYSDEYYASRGWLSPEEEEVYGDEEDPS
jgi:hypothetical protein